MRTSIQKPIIDAEAFMKFFEKTTGAKFVDVEKVQPAFEILTKQKSEKKSDYETRRGNKKSPQNGRILKKLKL